MCGHSTAGKNACPPRENPVVPNQTVRIHADTHAKLRELAQQSGESMTDVLGRAVTSYHRRVFLELLNRDFAALRADAKAWKEEVAERAQWDATLADGLEDD
jgi:predicted transcriptional regulator